MTAARVSAVLLVTALAGALPASAQLPTGGGVVQGRVVADATGEPIRGARIMSALRTVGRTAADGTFTVNVDQPGLRITKAGYAPLSLGRRAGVIEARMVRAALVTVTVLGPTGEPLPNVPLNRTCRRENGTGGGGSAGSTDDTGQARLALEPGTCQIGLARPPLASMQTAGPLTLEQVKAQFEELRKRVEANRQDTNALVVTLRPGDDVSLVVLASAEDAAQTTGLPPTGQRQGARESASIAGRVLDTGGRPLPGVRVNAQSRTARAMVATDTNGTYAIADLPAGEFTVTASLSGFLSGAPGQLRDDAPAPPVALQEGQQLAGANIVLLRGSVLSGTVLDEYGDPVEGVMVQLGRPAQGDTITVAPPPGLPAALTLFRSSTGGTAAMGRTDDRGQFRLTGLRAGTYVLAAESSDDSSSSRLIYYPDTPSRADATPIDVPPATESGGYVLRLGSSFAGRLSGTVVNAAGTAPASASVRLFRVGGIGTQLVAQRAADAAGAFAFTGLEPGEYELHAVSSPAPFAFVVQPGDAPALPVAPVEYGNARAAVSESGFALVRTLPPVTLRGRAEISGGPAEPMSGFRLVPLGERLITPLQDPSVPLDARGGFEFTRITGPTRFVLRSSTPGWWLRSLTIDGVNAAEALVDFSTGPRLRTDVRAVIARAAPITGSVHDAQNAAVPAGTVVAFPTDPERRLASSPFVQVVRASGEGDYLLYLPPGQYWIAAIDRAIGLSTELMQSLAPRATLVSVTDVPMRQDLTLISMPR